MPNMIDSQGSKKLSKKRKLLRVSKGFQSFQAINGRSHSVRLRRLNRSILELCNWYIEALRLNIKAYPLEIRMKYFRKSNGSHGIEIFVARIILRQSSGTLSKTAEWSVLEMLKCSSSILNFDSL